MQSTQASAPHSSQRTALKPAAKPLLNLLSFHCQSTQVVCGTETSVAAALQSCLSGQHARLLSFSTLSQLKIEGGIICKNGKTCQICLKLKDTDKIGDQHGKNLNFFVNTTAQSVYFKFRVVIVFLVLVLDLVIYLCFDSVSTSLVRLS